LEDEVREGGGRGNDGTVDSVTRVFFFSSRRRHTRWPRDWSSDVCSSDLSPAISRSAASGAATTGVPLAIASTTGNPKPSYRDGRSEERRVGKECRSRRAAGQDIKEPRERSARHLYVKLVDG